MADAKEEARNSVSSGDMKLEVVVIPVSDVDCAKEFYGRLGCGSTPTVSPATSV